MLKVKVPTDMSEVTVGQYQEVMAFAQTKASDRDLTSKMIEVFCGVKDAALMEYADMVRISKHLTKMLQAQPNLIVFWEKKGFIPNLAAITFGELIDLDTYLPETKNLHKAMAVLYRDVTAKSRDLYQVEKYKGAGEAQEYKQMPLDVAMSAMVFFWSIAKDLVSDTLPFLEMPKPITEAQTLADRLSLFQSGDGTQGFTNLQPETLRNTTKSQASQQANV